MTRTNPSRAEPASGSASGSAGAYAMLGLGGRRLRVADWNRDAPCTAVRPPVLLFAGIGMNLEMLEPVVAAMPDRRIISFDMPGIGGSPDPLLPYTLSSMALTIVLLLDRLKLDRVDVIGMSWGGALAQQFAFQHRHRTRKLVLAATGAGGTMLPGNPSLLAELADPTQMLREKPLKRTLSMLYGGGAHKPLSLNAATAPSPWGWSCQLGAFALWTSLPFLPTLDMPTLVMADEDDQIIPSANARVLASAIPGARLVLFKGGGHLFMLAKTPRFVREVDAFLDEPES